MNDVPGAGQDQGDPARRRSLGKPGGYASSTPGDSVSGVPIPCRIVALRQEQNRLFAFPPDVLAEEIKKTGFSCTLCGACCTRAVNRHVFLLDRDVEAVRAIDPGAYVPAPDPEFCDETGTVYDSGYALFMDGGGACRFLKNNRCRIYDRRFSVCRIYPHMLRRDAGRGDEHGWCTFARMNGHGTYATELSGEACLSLAREVLEYEHGFLSQQIAFLETVHEYFTVHGLRHDPAQHHKNVQRLHDGLPVPVKVFHAGELEDWQQKTGGMRGGLFF